ncbi:hypothetical protein P22_2813 [Propionispora sp. 2/2-37]|uniref:hypothetical protein n=1 Tax=Propionispora sp. 2/2-37 TaxID=1677858 RepID=UPI0006BB7B44|nr:hypothetical protein [Propionispora sp. 2/2-37]CUH96723.1 hypothetical protein P22_2813 [Propionispora sp. 2/2-37]
MPRLFKSARQTTVISVTPTSQLNSAYLLLLQIRPVIARGIKDLDEYDPKHVIIEVGLMSYLMGMGFDYRTACTIVKSWEKDEELFDPLLLED